MRNGLPDKNKLREKMKVLKSLIRDNKLSREKSIELEIDYCYLQRIYDNILEIEKLKIKR